MKTLAYHQAQHLTIEEYKNAFKQQDTPFLYNLTNKNGRFYKETEFFLRFAGVLFLGLVFFVAMLIF